jgi:hypothetical protein
MNVFYLTVKDLRLHYLFLVVLLMAEAVGILVLRLGMPQHLPGVLFLVSNGMLLIGDFLISHRTMIAEEKDRALLFLQSLPISTAELIGAKFVANAILVAVNYAALLLLLEIPQRLNIIDQEPPTPLSLLVGALLIHFISNSFFVAVSLLFESERMFWIPFPGLFLAIAALLNFNRVVTALHLEGVVRSCTGRPAWILLLLALVEAGLLLATLRLARLRRLLA